MENKQLLIYMFFLIWYLLFYFYWYPKVKEFSKDRTVLNTTKVNISRCKS